MSNTLTYPQLLSLPMGPNDAKALTVRRFLVSVMERVWENGDDFSGRRAFGHIGWRLPLYALLVSESLVTGTLRHDGSLDHCDQEADDAIIIGAIHSLR